MNIIYEIVINCLLLKMATKSQEKNKSSTKHEQKSQHFTEVTCLRQQVHRLRKEINQKNQTILEVTAKHQTTVGYLLNELKNLLSSLSDEKSESAKLEELETAVMHCISDMRRFANYEHAYNQSLDQLQKCLPCSAQPLQQSICQSLTLDYEAPQGQTIKRERITALNIIASQQLDYLQAELRKHQSRSEQLLLDGQKWKEQSMAISGRLAQNQVELRRISQQNNGLKQKNRQLTLQLEASKQQLGHTSSKLQSLKRENKRLIEQHRQSFHSQQALNSIIADNQREIQKICTEAYKLKLQIHGFQLKFKEIVENDERQRELEMLKPKKQEQKVVLCEVPTQNTIDTLQSKSSKLDAARLIKINLQFYQEKLMNFSSAASIYLS